MPPAASRNTIRRLLNAVQHTACPCHGCRTGGAHNPIQALNQLRKYATPVDMPPPEKEYAFEVSHLRHRRFTVCSCGNPDCCFKSEVRRGCYA